MSSAQSAGGLWRMDEDDGGHLAGRWWKWALSAPDDRSPVRDTTGEHAAWNQPADVWFLAGTYGGRVERRCAMPAGRPVFFPVLNVQHTWEYSQDHLTMRFERADASLNGVRLALREFRGGFRLDGERRLAWGVWGGLEPLAPGHYVLEIKGKAGDFLVDTTYHLTVTAGY
ncbi:hypothetical protein [Streptomyces chilikensis]|uniref:hypothetical protein n=1 Tax=Streptomyces chilikensis TaxID=1194079 RepID=UPI000AA52075|nr:hypothetical protein [Streptomyces chilikensis]